MERLGYVPPESSENAAPDGAAEESEPDSTRADKSRVIRGLQDAAEGGSQSELHFHTYYDPMREKQGSAFQSHPKKMKKILKSLEQRGIRVEYREGSMSYSPSSSGGSPGHLIMDPAASYSAWLHELKHLADDEASGWQGLSMLIIPEKALSFETAAYRVEIDYARKHGYNKIARRLERLLFERRQEILGTERNNKQPHE